MQPSWVIVASLLLLVSAGTGSDLDEEPAPRIQPRIFKGKEITNGALGGMGVQLFYKTKLVCTGTLITERHFITAGHCFNNMTLSEFHVIGGQTREFDRHKKLFHKNRLVGLRIHPDFDKESFIGDIAVAKIKYPLRSKYIGYAQVCKSPLYPSDVLTVAGWGSSGRTSDKSTLRSMRVAIVDKGVCERQLKLSLPENVICAGGYNSRTLCAGDSGGPLMFRQQVCGVSTWTYKCGNNAKPDIFMSVRHYSKFVIKAVRDLGFK
ncbi:seminase [Drosophila takahashii]|uniref:seminase n=1 Tax=Drosophila takahashii TaxID=29030 RepID=UPI001CF8F75E|nr:seminase [Drosophila takahashii]